MHRLRLIPLAVLGLLVVASSARTEPAGGLALHVLLVSIDGLHAVDLANYTLRHPQSALAELSRHGVTYTNASTPWPSDSFPGLLALVTGGSPVSTGVFYDDSYDRALSPPGSACVKVGTAVVFDEAIDKDPRALDAGGGIDPAKLPMDPARGCAPVYPHEFVRVNTVFEVAHQAGRRTAWADKHPAYDLVHGPSGQGVDDLYTPEIAARDEATGSVAGAVANDDLKVQAILHQIDGLDHTGLRQMGVPTIFVMNFQAASVAQKLAGHGYTDASGTPSPGLVQALDAIDQALGRLTARLQARGLLDSTLIVVTAKHGQSPMDPTRRRIIDSKLIPSLVEGVQKGLLAHATQDDVALIWLTDPQRTDEVVTALRANQGAVGIDDIYTGESLRLLFEDPRHDPRVPDLIIQPVPGVIYTKPTSSKIAEHGGFIGTDTHVALLVSQPRLDAIVVRTPVQTTQVAPTLLKALGLDPQALRAVQIERTAVLPGLGLERTP
jgi:hypothetical protein